MNAEQFKRLQAFLSNDEQCRVLVNVAPSGFEIRLQSSNGWFLITLLEEK